MKCVDLVSPYFQEDYQFEVGMNLNGKVVSVELSAIVHATENVEKVKTAILNLLPPATHDSIAFTRTYVRGHYGNPIVVFSTKVEKEKLARMIVEHLFSIMEPNTKEELTLILDKSMDEDGNFYIRLDKNEALRRRIKLTSRDPIRVKIGIRMWRPALNIARSALKDLGLV
ncbi:hypothetical protein KEJ51_01625 [Candidatus Bathyarchaeota archaeon]|nr:hypothetical protein [Candidatus Bathyarchaeota archaeon]MBS7628658.1 hypothetical protein [Candidatus Bathyarchaeota archaeon]